MIDGSGESSGPEWVEIDIDFRSVPNFARQVVIAALTLFFLVALAVAAVMSR